MLERPHLNFRTGTGITLALADNPTLNAIDVTIGSTGVISGTWTWTTTATPASGRVRTSDLAAWAPVTSLAIAELTAPGVDARAALAQVTAGDIVRLQDASDSAKWARYTISAAGTDAGDYFTFPVSYLDGAGVPPANNQDTLVSFKTAGGGGAGGDGLPAPGSNGQVLTVVSGAWAAADPTVEVEY